MSEPREQNRRAYRVTPETSGHIMASAVLADGAEAAADIIDAATGGVAVRFPRLKRGDLEMGQRFDFQLRSERLSAPLLLASQVVQLRRGHQLPLEANIAFMDWARGARDLETVFRRLFNQRHCFRVTPSIEDVDRFRIVLRAHRGTRSVRSWLRDMSASGIGLWVPTKRVLVPGTTGPDPDGIPTRLLFGGNDTLAVVGDVVELRIHVPGQRDPFQLAVQLRHLAAWPGAPRARVGLGFPEERELPRHAHSTVLRYVGDRQRQLRQMEQQARSRAAEESRPIEATGSALRPPPRE